jgi:hypothetical protein
MVSPAYATPSNVPFVKVFLTACVTSYAKPAAVAEQAQLLGLTEIEGAVADSYLTGRAGKAWQGQIEQNIYAITLLADGSCSVFAQEGDAKQLREAVESWLPPAESGISIAREQVAAPQGLQSFRYVLHGGNVHEEWTLTVCMVDLPNPLRAIVTYRGL